MQEFQRAIALIREAPERWPVYLYGTRYCPLRKFPYIVVHRYAHGNVYVISVAHTRRRPGFWRRRLT